MSLTQTTFQSVINIILKLKCQNKGARGGHDMNVNGAWQLGYTGKGVVVTILDDGIEHSHGDLRQNYVRQRETEFIASHISADVFLLNFSGQLP